ncbi:DNA polymerase IV [Tissierella sp.]|uniref:DNA polymerase Y family protein n=1 Tax=Tissierella sp. TaxID=41274 RepID=UPI0028654C2E|nr:DNA polymerase IV [Tissierella sp.]MDR7856669.1 DNA polymerase IV [Tissierella sp.]
MFAYGKEVVFINGRIIFHIDVNSAYLSWEAAYRIQHGAEIDLREIPSIVCGNQEKRHGIILAKSITAKKYNIITGESVHSALQKCPHLTMVPPNYELYIKASDAMKNILEEYSPSIQRYSIDECFLDYSHGKKHWIDTTYEIKERLKKELGFTVNIGVSSNKLLAKMASDFKKPDMVHSLFPYEIKDKMWPLPVGDLFMVGGKTRAKLNGRGIFTIGELANLDRDYIHSWLKKPGLLIWEYANGIDNSLVRNNPLPMKSVGNSTTISFDVDNRKEAHMVLLALSEKVGMRIRNINQCGYVVSISLKNNDFFYSSHQTRLDIPTDSTNTIYRTAKKLFDELWKGDPLRHISLSISNLLDNDFFQLSLFKSINKKEEILDKTIDKIRAKFGQESVFRSCFLYSGIDPLIGGVIMEEEYPMMSSKI